MADDTGRCVNCGFLCKRRAVIDAESIVYEATSYDRQNGFYRHSGWPDQRDTPTRPACFRNVANLEREFVDALTMGEQKAVPAQKEYARVLIEKPRKCKSWYPWTEYHNPKEHYEEYKI